jgi:hypothetical protein
MSTDYRTLCAELVDAIGSLVGGVKCGHYQQKDMWKCREIFDRARAALAQPEPDEVTPAEIYRLIEEVDQKGLARPGLVRAALARWGRPAIQPVPGKDRSPDTYWERHVQATNAAGPGGPTWNQSYLAELQRRGLALATARPPHDCDAWYLSGAPMEAPLPHPDGGITWPLGTLIIWAPPVPIPTSQEVLCDG